MFYRHDNTICTCSAAGHWITKICKIKFQRLKSIDNPNLIMLKTNIDCSPNEIYLIDCNICKCSPTRRIDFAFCTSRTCPLRDKGDSCTSAQVYRSAKEFCSCSDLNYFIDKLCIKVKDEIVQKIDEKEISKLLHFGNKLNKIGHFCNDTNNYNTTLTIDCNNCTCRGEGKLICSKHDCAEKTVLRSDSAEKNASIYLPKLGNINDKCKPGVKYKYKCNTCVCNKVGQAICTSTICVEDLVVDKPFLGWMSVH